MTAEKLIEFLQTLPKDTEVILSSDREGNRCSPLAGLIVGAYCPKTTWSGEFMDTPKSELINVATSGAVCLFPIN